MGTDRRRGRCAIDLGARKGIKPGGCPLFLGKGPDCVADPFGTFLVGAVNGLRKRKRTNQESPWRVPGQIGKIPEKSGKSQKGLFTN